MQKLALAVLLLAGAWQSPAADPAMASGPRYRVLTLSSSDPYLPAFQALDSAARASIAAGLGSNVEYFVEPLDMMRFPRDRVEASTVALLRERYEGIRIDALIVGGHEAWDFATRNRDLWPGAPIVFEVVSPDVMDPAALGPRDTGVLLSFDVKGTVDLVLRLRPRTRRLVVIAGTGDFDRWLMGHTREELREYPGALVVEYITDRSIEEINGLVGQLPDDAAVLFLTVLRDTTGVPNVPRPEIRAVAPHSRVPIFTLLETHIGTGAVAGAIVPWGEQGRLVGELVVKLLSGNGSAERAPLEVPPARCIADARELRKWDIEARALPAGCEVRHRPLTLWSQYRAQVLVAGAVILGQGLLIGALLWQRRRRRLAEVALVRQGTELAHAGRLAAIGELTAAITHEINQPLSAILANVSSAQLLIDSGKTNGQELRQVLDDVQRDNLRASEVVKRLRSLLLKHETSHEAVDLNEGIAEVLQVLDAEARRRQVTLLPTLEAGLPTVRGDRVQLQQVVLNLVMNSMDAVSGVPADDRVIEVRTSHRESDVLVSVIDRGVGVPAEDAVRLFDSFFTTKGQGMGLGLSIARSIVESHGGRIWLDAAPGKGAAFHFTIPVESGEERS